MNTDTTLTLLGFTDGDRVRGWGGNTGTVRIGQHDPRDAAESGEHLWGEVRWDDSFVHDELELAIRRGLQRVAE